MYSVKRLANIAVDGLGELVPALQAAWNADPTDDRMVDVYGTRPRLTALFIGLGCVAAGDLFARFGPDLPLGQYVNWPAVFVAAVFAALIRRYLFRSNQARPEDFPWLAASVAPAFALTVVATPVSSALFGDPAPGTAMMTLPETEIGVALKAITDATGLAALLTISLATLCFSRRWADALITLAVRLLVFNIMIWVTAKVMLELDLVSTIIGAVTGWRLPRWVADLADALGYATLLMTAYLAVIGGTWTVSRRNFEVLLDSGEADVLSDLQRLIEKPDKAKQASQKAKARGEDAAGSKKSDRKKSDSQGKTAG